MHPGQARMEESVLKYFTWPGCTSAIRNYVKQCDVCQRYKTANVGKVGKVPLRDPPNMDPWDLLTVDLCGPWSVEVEYKKDGKLEKKVRKSVWALTMMDEATSWIEIIPISNKESKTIALLVDSEWFCRYPRPLFCIYDNGKEFIGEEFQEMLESYGIKKIRQR